MKKSIIVCIAILFMTSAVLTAQVPQWRWAKQAGGSSVDEGKGIIVDADGNSYVIGNFKDTVTFGTTTLTSSGDYDVFVAKFDPNGNWQWVKQAGGTGFDEGYSVRIDGNGSLYVSGCFTGTATFGATTLTSSGDNDIFVAKFDTDGNWQWVKQAGGSYLDQGVGISVDGNGDLYVTGFFSETATFGTTTLTSSGDCDVFVAKIDTDGNWQWVKQAGGIGDDFGTCISIDANGSPYTTGYFADTAYFGADSLISAGGYDIFVAKFDTAGNWQWVKQAGGTGLYDMGNGISVGANGNLYFTGCFSETATFGTTTLTSSGGTDICVAVLDANGNWEWAKQAGGSSYDMGLGISVDANGNSYVTGYFKDTATFGATSLVSKGGYDIFVAKNDTEGNWQWIKQAGGSRNDKGFGISVDADGNSYVTGYFRGTATFGAFTLTGNGGYDIFVTELADSSVAVDNPESDTHFEKNVLNNYPNPFKNSTTISYSIKGMLKSQPVKINIYNMIGQFVDRVEGRNGTATWNTSNHSTGIYFYKLNTDSYSEIRKMMVTK